MYPVGDLVAVQVMLEQRQRHDQWHQTIPIVLDMVQQLYPLSP